MGFFGVATSPGADGVPKIQRCHINLWTLGGLFGHRCSYFDVGLLIKAPKDGLRSLQIGVPFETSEDPTLALECLRHPMLNPVVSGLIFANDEVLNSADKTLKFGDEKTQVVGVDVPQCQLEQDPKDRTFSLWNIHLAPALKGRESGYVRIRFLIQRTGRMWRWQKSLFSKSGGLLDLRLYDERESVTVKNSDGFVSRAVPVKDLNAFSIMPAKFNATITTPEAVYVRALEGKVWRPYLKRRTNLGRQDKYLIYRWLAEDRLSIKSPVRIFQQFQRESSPWPSGRDFVLLLLAFALATLVFDIEFNSFDWVSDSLKGVSTFVTSGSPSAIGLYVLLSAAVLFAAVAKLSRKVGQFARGLRSRVDEFVYSLFIDNG